MIYGYKKRVSLSFAEAEKKVREELAKAEGIEHITEELADVMELIDTILEVNGLDLETIRKAQKAKAEIRGGFKGKILMLEKV